MRSRAVGPTLTTLQATQLINSKNAQIVDLRSAGGLRQGLAAQRAQHAVRQAHRTACGELKKDKPVILVVCAPARPPGKVAAQLRASGFAEVFVLGGGLAAWRDAGLPLRSVTAGSVA